MGNSLVEIFENLKKESGNGNCSVCRTATKMDAETKEAFIDVMKSTVTIKAIVDALAGEGITMSRYQLGEVRRECLNGLKTCGMFKKESK